MRGRWRNSHNDWVMMVSSKPGAASAHSVSSTRVPLLLTRRNIHIPPTISQNHDSVPITTPLCHGERNSKMALDGHQTNVGTKNHSR